jgi:hypothetical protein
MSVTEVIAEVTLETRAITEDDCFRFYILVMQEIFEKAVYSYIHDTWRREKPCHVRKTRALGSLPLFSILLINGIFLFKERSLFEPLIYGKGSKPTGHLLGQNSSTS